MRVWIDIANAPHVRFFGPVVDRLRDDGDEVFLTARAHRETPVLARERWPSIELDGASSPSGRIGKGVAIAGRVSHLVRRARAFRPDVALSHNSYAQIAAASALRIPAVTAMDYEHQPANHVAFRLARRVVVPDAFPDSSLRHAGASPGRVRRYEGLKEQLYLGLSATPTDQIDQLGVPTGARLAVVRLPPDGALYHRSENPLVAGVIDELLATGHTVVVLARSVEQRAAWRERRADTLIVPDPPVDTRSLLQQADIVVGAGGTMTREAAVLGVPTLSVFAGETAAVDRWLEQQGRIAFVRDTEDVKRLTSLLPVATDLLAASRDRGPLEVLLAAVREFDRG
jgi:predicted glycosyltransferase